MSMGDGAGGVIHCSTTVKRGNAYTDYSKWTHWGIPRGLYTTDELRREGLNVQDGENLPTLRRGSRGEAVTRLQQLLKEQTNAGLKVDGIFGANTESAVQHFQELHGLQDDGIVGPKTWAALGVDKNVNQPADNGNNSVDDPPWTPEGETVRLAQENWRAIRAAVATMYGIIKKYEEE
jgi:peptidoglycan hydrolase-like protein with peptidoglycan-binding domain